MMSITAPSGRRLIDGHPQAPIDVGMPISGDVCDAGVVQVDRAEGMSEAVEASYEEEIASLSSNKGEFSLVHVTVLTCMQGTTPMIMIMWTSLINR